MKLPPPGYMPPEFCEIDGFCPVEFQVVSDLFRFRRAVLEHLERYGPAQRIYDTLLVPDAVLNPRRIYSGLQRANYRNGLCYCSLPETRTLVVEEKKVDDEIDEMVTEVVAAPQNKVFCVFVNLTGSKYTILDWQWRESDRGTPDAPMNASTHFGRLLWPIN